MKDLLGVAILFLSLTVSLGVVGFLMYKGVSGWGWILFVIVLLFGNMSIKVD